MILPTSQIGHHHKVTNITRSPTSLSPYEHLDFSWIDFSCSDIKVYKICINYINVGGNLFWQGIERRSPTCRMLHTMCYMHYQHRCKSFSQINHKPWMCVQNWTIRCFLWWPISIVFCFFANDGSNIWWPTHRHLYVVVYSNKSVDFTI